MTKTEKQWRRAAFVQALAWFYVAGVVAAIALAGGR